MTTAAATKTAVADTLEQLRLDVHRHIAPVLRAIGVEEHEVLVTVDGALQSLHVVLKGPAALDAVSQTIGVRVLDAVHAQPGTFGRVDVVVRT